MSGKLFDHNGSSFAVLICDHRENMKIVETINDEDVVVFESSMELVE